MSRRFFRLGFAELRKLVIQKTVGARLKKMTNNRLGELRQKCADLGLPSLLSRSWCQIRAPAIDEQVIRVMQWNVLAQALSQGDNNFVLCPGKALRWDVRRVRLIEEILTRAPDVVCMEEVDTMTHFDTELSKVGYAGLFFPKLCSPCLDFENNTGPDGCAVFYLKDRLTLLSHDNINIYVPPGQTLCNQVGILATFRQKSVHQPQAFHVVVTHLKAKSGYEDLRRRQVEYLTDWVWQKVGADPVIICGDFNGHPREPFYEAMEKSKLNLTSVYRMLSQDHQEPCYTTWKVRGAVDGQAKEEQQMTEPKREEQQMTEVKGEEQQTTKVKGEEQQTTKVKVEEQQMTEVKGEEQQITEVKGEEQQTTKVKGEEQQMTEVKGEEQQIIGFRGKAQTVEIEGEEKQITKFNGEGQQIARFKARDQQTVEVKGEEQQKGELKGKEEQISRDKIEQTIETTKAAEQGRCGATKESCSTIDYVWSSKGHFSVLGLLGLPSDEDIGSSRLPSLAYPSDHLSLVCDLILHS